MHEVLTLLLIFFITLLVVYLWQKYSFWRTKNVPTPFYLPIIGHFYISFYGYHWENIDKLYNKYKSNGFWGIYQCTNPVLYLTDLKLIKDVMVKEADFFIDRRKIQLSEDDAYFNEMLTIVTGQKWRSLRALMTPTFTSGKIKAMMPLIVEKCNVFLEESTNEMKNNGFVDMNSLLSYYTFDSIASCAFGLDANCLKDKNESEFVQNCSKVFNFELIGTLKFMLILMAPWLSKALKISFGDISYLAEMVKKNCEFREKSKTKRGDFLDILLDALKEQEKTTDSNKYPMTMNTVIAESVLFIFAGFDTTGNALAIAVYLLAQHKDVQKKLREELEKAVESEGELTYHTVMELQYLDAFISESLRLYPPAHMLERQCNKTYRFPEINVEIPQETMVTIPAWSLHRDPEYWEDPLTFNPDRFLPENKAKIIPYSYMPFGMGPRNCIGMRFAQLEVKLLLAHLCLKFDLDLRPGYKEMKLSKTLNTLRPDKNGVQVVIQKHEREREK